MTCVDCRNFNHCAAFYDHKPWDTYCDFFPRRFARLATISQATGGAS